MNNKFKIKNLKFKNSIQNLKFWRFRAYVFLVLLVGLFFIGLYILAQVEETPSVLKDWLAGKVMVNGTASECPNFVDKNDLTMKDLCTGLVWARHELPTYYDTAANLNTAGKEPGYTWDEADTTCTNLAQANLFRLPTVEELMSLIHYRCDASDCFAKAEDVSVNGVAPVFSDGIYWASSDFHESPDWTNINAIPPGTPERDYKRSVNLLTGEVDNPVFGKNMKLNAWCVVARNPEIVEREFTNVNINSISNGQKATSGTLQTIYHRACPTNDCSALSGTTCGATYFCSKTETVNVSQVINCDANFHVEGTTCAAYDIAGGSWIGNIFNGFWAPPALAANNPPSINITAPANNSSAIYPGTFTFEAQASDSDGTITRVDFYYNGSSYLGTDLSLPYRFEWKNIGIGTYAIKARAIDNIGAATYSDPINVTVVPNSPPTVNVTAPAANSTIDGPLDLQITAQVTDTDGTISSIEFFQRTPAGTNTLITGCSFKNLAVDDITKNCILQNAGYSDTSGPSDYILTVIAFDNYGDATISEIPITIKNVNPPITITKVIAVLPAGGPREVTGANLEGARFPVNADLKIFATLNMVAKANEAVRFYQGDTRIGSSIPVLATMSEYSITWQAVAEGNYSLTAKTADIYDREKISAPVNIIVAPEICNNNIDDDGDGNFDNGCVPIHFNIAGESNDVYYAYYRPHDESVYSFITSRTDNNLGSVLTGQKAFDFLVKPGWYDFKIDYYSSAVGNFTPYYSNINISIAGTAQSAVDILGVAASGQSSGGHANSCALASPPAPNQYACTLATPACSQGETLCSPENANHGRAEFSALVFSSTDRKIFITVPVNDATFDVFTDNINIQAHAYSPNSISKVEFYAKRSDWTSAQLLGTDIESPYSYDWGVSFIHSRVYELTAKAYDSQGNFISSPITITKN